MTPAVKRHAYDTRLQAFRNLFNLNSSHELRTDAALRLAEIGFDLNLSHRAICNTLRRTVTLHRWFDWEHLATKVQCKTEWRIPHSFEYMLYPLKHPAFTHVGVKVDDASKNREVFYLQCTHSAGSTKMFIPSTWRMKDLAAYLERTDNRKETKDGK